MPQYERKGNLIVYCSCDWLQQRRNTPIHSVTPGWLRLTAREWDLCRIQSYKPALLMVFYEQRVQELIYNRQMLRTKIKIKISQIQLRLTTAQEWEQCTFKAPHLADQDWLARPKRQCILAACSTRDYWAVPAGLLASKFHKVTKKWQAQTLSQNFNMPSSTWNLTSTYTCP